jgi:crotonobetainyl-CoA:carnitine CoA-transferase CaiB-like acyl-CoA transferase
MRETQVPLTDFTISDSAIHAVGSSFAHLLSQSGAECTEFESRSAPDAFGKPRPGYGGMSAAAFDRVSANRLSVTPNLKLVKAVALAKRVVAVSDVAAGIMCPGVRKRVGLDFDALRIANSDVVMVSLASSEHTGPDSDFSYAPLLGLWGGPVWMCGYSGVPPVEMRHVLDHSARMHVAPVTVTAPSSAATDCSSPTYLQDARWRWRRSGTLHPCHA